MRLYLSVSMKARQCINMTKIKKQTSLLDCNKLNVLWSNVGFYTQNKSMIKHVGMGESQQ